MRHMRSSEDLTFSNEMTKGPLSNSTFRERALFVHFCYLNQIKVLVIYFSFKNHVRTLGRVYRDSKQDKETDQTLSSLIFVTINL